MRLPAKDQGLHQVRSVQFPFSLNTACFARYALGVLFQNRFQSGSHICYTGHRKAPVSRDIVFSKVLISSQMEPFLSSPFLSWCEWERFLPFPSLLHRRALARRTLAW